jgi:hypothetical protein
VTFTAAVPFGPALFERLYRGHLLLAAPLSQDTPRSALDGFAAGQVILSYDTYYYAELAGLGALVIRVPWPNVEALGHKLAALAADRERLGPMLRSAVAFARENTQEKWLDQRINWTRALFPEAYRQSAWPGITTDAAASTDEVIE